MYTDRQTAAKYILSDDPLAKQLKKRRTKRLHNSIFSFIATATES